MMLINHVQVLPMCGRRTDVEVSELVDPNARVCR